MGIATISKIDAVRTGLHKYNPSAIHSVDFIDHNNGWVTGRNGTILRTTDGGNSWHQQLTRTWYDVSSVCFLDLNNGWVSGDYGLIMATSNGGGIVSVEINENNSETETFYLGQNYPNPFNPSTTISWQSSAGGWHTLKVYDVLGNEVATLIDEYKPAGIYSVQCTMNILASGIYFYQLKVFDPESGSGQSFIQTKKMIYLK